MEHNSTRLAKVAASSRLSVWCVVQFMAPKNLLAQIKCAGLAGREGRSSWMVLLVWPSVAKIPSVKPQIEGPKTLERNYRKLCPTCLRSRSWLATTTDRPQRFVRRDGGGGCSAIVKAGVMASPLIQDSRCSVGIVVSGMEVGCLDSSY